MQTPHKEPDQKYEITKLTNREILISINDRKYQLTNFNLRRLNDFSFTVKLSWNDHPPFIDTVNLTRFRYREGLIQAARDHLFLGEDTLKNDVSTLMKAVGKLQEAESLYKRLLASIPVYSQLYYQLANLEGALNKKGEGFYYYGYYYWYEGDLDSARHHFSQAISLLPQDSRMRTEAQGMLKKIARIKKK